ncbi:MAG: penicillin acylase family protein [Alphaproteobacteria bacterium]|jgi:penicillin amidase|nr:penicillin acylase family protein [Alphaproteobacteria bacterium]
MAKLAKYFSLAVAATLGGCSLLAPLPPKSDLDGRLAAFPTSGLPLDNETVIHWNARQVPFIFADSDADAAFALGLVHAHLRLGQMEMMRHISRGRLSELVGPFTTDIDRTLRILDLGRAAGDMEAGFPPETRIWLERFIDGVNHYQDAMTVLPYEHRLFGLNKQPWNLADIITIGRLAASDVSWLVWFRIWKLRTRPDWPQLWAALLRDGSNDMTVADEAGEDEELALIGEMLGGMSRSGSNSVVVSAARSKNGHALIANDPHLGFTLPNLWLLAGVKSPSYHMAGMMIPGLPFIAVGRNPDIAWGGTNLRAASSDLFDVSELPPGEITSREEKIGVRWWFDDSVTLRDSPFGPIISDSPLLRNGVDEAIAMRWMGHRGSDEFSAMLQANRARDWDGFVTAFENFSVSAQNMLYADAKGNIGHLMATQLPARDNAPPPMIYTPPAGAPAWQRFVGVRSLPLSYNPEAGYLVSANNRPQPSEVPVGYFFSPSGRAMRLAALLESEPEITPEHLRALQTDIVEPAADAINQALVQAAEHHGVESGLSPAARAVLNLITDWDGEYATDAAQPVAFEATFFHFLRRFYTPRLGADGLHAFVAAADFGRTLPRDIAEADGETIAQALAGALEDAVAAVRNYGSWGDMHRLRLIHPLGQLPIIGGRFTFAEFPSAGSRQTVMKTNHAPSDEEHYASYGSQARHISDMSDLDENYFTLLGGQDGWLGSSTFVDQVELWRAGDYIHIPLRPESVRKAFPRRMILKPN